MCQQPTLAFSRSGPMTVMNSYPCSVPWSINSLLFTVYYQSTCWLMVISNLVTTAAGFPLLCFASPPIFFEEMSGDLRLAHLFYKMQ